MSETALHRDVPAAGDLARVGDFVALLKPRVMSLVVFTGLAGLVLAPGSLHPVLAAVALLCIAVGAGASGAINMWYDRDIDAGMARTRNRPIPAGRMDPGAALGFGATLAVGSVTLMALAVNWMAAALLALTIGFYVFVYTMWLKRRTPQNIVIGGAAGAFPPMIGWAAVTGDVTLMPVVLFAIIFLWTPPHFWALSLYKAGEYAAVNVPMLPVVAGREATRRQIVVYSLILAPLAVLPWVLGYSGIIYGAASVVLGAVFVCGAVRVWRDKSDKSAKGLFAYSILYLFLLFAILMVDALALRFWAGV
ncbi:MAG TPA: heme o synthase [Alphaproteobacteria bacterium]|nr:heme o synthase [Alphaproteobacteria bacterium]